MQKPPTDLLERVLRDLNAEQRARVLELVVRLDLDKDDPLWLVALAIGQLQVLVEDAPEDWQTLFQDFQGDLNTWTKTHLHTLEVVADKARVTASLSEYTQELGCILKTLVTACNALMQRLHSSEMNSLDLSTQLKRSTTTIETGLEELKAQSKRQNRHVLEALENLRLERNPAARRGENAAAKLAALFSGLALLGILAALAQLQAFGSG